MTEETEAELTAYKEAVRVMLGFRTTTEVEETFRRPLVQAAMAGLEEALFAVRRNGQPDEFALAAAVEMLAKDKAQAARSDLDIDKVFDDPNYHTLPDAALEASATELWQGPSE